MDQYSVFSSFFFRIYTVLWKLVRPFLKHKKRLADGWNERLVPAGWCGKTDIWIQVASAGEAHLALAVLKALPAGLKKNILLTIWTMQGKQVFEAGLPAALAGKPGLQVQVRFAALDDPEIVTRAMHQAKPEKLILFETELWPGLLGACAENGVPVYILNARMSKLSLELYSLIRQVLRSTPVVGIYAISASDAARFTTIFGHDTVLPCKIDVMPNIKFDRAAEELAHPLNCELVELFRMARKVFLFASVREQEEERLAPLLGKIFHAFPEAVIIVAPRHMTRVDSWKTRLYDLGFQPKTVAELKEDDAAQPGKAVVWDVFGGLAKLYAVADAVFVGGSIGLGGQNFLEALVGGVVPCVGSSLENFRWALGEDIPPTLVEAGLLKICRNPREILEQMIAGAQQEQNREEIRHKFSAWLAPRLGGSELAAETMQEVFLK